jgi:uncharacterized protein YcbK (DUF882 family)
MEMKGFWVAGIAVTMMLALCLTVEVASSYGGAAGVKRFFYSGDGKIYLVNAKNGVSFHGTYRDGNSVYSEKALREIDRVFGANPSNESSIISLRLIELLDFLQDHLRPGARITIVSGYRSPEYNHELRAEGRLAAKASLHQYGMAADIIMDGVRSDDIWNYIKDLGFGGAGYYHGALVHVDVGPARSWDEKTSGVHTDISNHNKLIGMVTDSDIYLPGEVPELRFIRMTAFPIGVQPVFELERVEEDGSLKRVCSFDPAFRFGTGGVCPRFGDISQMMDVKCGLPENVPPGLYRIRARFCDNPWEEMPADALTPAFEVIQK